MMMMIMMMIIIIIIIIIITYLRKSKGMTLRMYMAIPLKYTMRLELAFKVFSNYYALEFIDTPFHGQFDVYKRLLLLQQP